MPRVISNVPRLKRKKQIMKARQGRLRRPQQAVEGREGDRRARLEVRVPRSQEQEARLPPALDRAHQRRRASARHELQRVHERPQARPASRSTGRSWPTSPCSDPAAFARARRQGARRAERCVSHAASAGNSAAARPSGRAAAVSFPTAPQCIPTESPTLRAVPRQTCRDLDARGARGARRRARRRRRARGGAHRSSSASEARRADSRCRRRSRDAARRTSGATPARAFNDAKTALDDALDDASGRSTPRSSAALDASTSRCRRAGSWRGGEASRHARHRRDRGDLPRARLHRRARARRPRPSGTTSARSTSRRTIRRWTCTTRCTSDDGVLLRTHTSPVQVRTLQRYRAADSHPRAGQRVSAAISSTRRTRRCSRRSKGSPSTKASASSISRRRSLTSRALLRRDAHALPSELLPVHRAVGRDGRRVPALRRLAAARRARAPAGWRSSARAWCIRRCSRRRASTASGTPAGRSAWDRRASRCSATACPTSGSSTTPTCASWSRSRE